MLQGTYTLTNALCMKELKIRFSLDSPNFTPKPFCSNEELLALYLSGEGFLVWSSTFVFVLFYLLHLACTANLGPLLWNGFTDTLHLEKADKYWLGGSYFKLGFYGFSACIDGTGARSDVGTSNLAALRKENCCFVGLVFKRFSQIWAILFYFQIF